MYQCASSKPSSAIRWSFLAEKFPKTCFSTKCPNMVIWPEMPQNWLFKFIFRHSSCDVPIRFQQAIINCQMIIFNPDIPKNVF